MNFFEVVGDELEAALAFFWEVVGAFDENEVAGELYEAFSKALWVDGHED